MYETLANTFNTQFTTLIAAIGKTIQCDTGGGDCPNCTYDYMMERSTNIEDSTNPFSVNIPASSIYNRELKDGNLCPVCGGKGTLPQWYSMTALVNWNTQDHTDYENVILSSRRCQIKVSNDQYSYVRKYGEFIVPAADGTTIKCKKVTEPTGFGIGPHKFLVFYVEAMI